jgi:AraC-like DNA-binding protein
MADVFLFVRGAAFGLILLLLLRLYLGYRQLLTGRLMLALFVGLGAYTVAPFLGSWPSLLYPAVLLATSVPPVFWLFSQALFNDWDRKQLGIGSVRIAVVLLFLAVSFASFLSAYDAAGGLRSFDAGLFYLAHLLRIIFMLLALAAIIGQWRQDLIESRRRLRIIIVSVAGGYILAVVCVELLLYGNAAPLALEIGNSILIVLMLLATSAWLAQSGPEGLSATLGMAPPDAQHKASPAEQKKELTATEQTWLAALQQHMETESGYHRSNLTIRSLGAQLSIPEHLLRRLINKHLGYRNFNDYLNYYRIAEAATRLADPQQGRLPILTIALEVGYGSLTPFNRAFKAQYQQTPSEYRRQMTD